MIADVSIEPAAGDRGLPAFRTRRRSLPELDRYPDRRGLRLSNLRQTLTGLSGRQFLVAIRSAGLVLGLALSWAGQKRLWIRLGGVHGARLLVLLFDIVMSLRRGEIDDARQPRTKHVRGFFVIS